MNMFMWIVAAFVVIVVLIGMRGMIGSWFRTLWKKSAQPPRQQSSQQRTDERLMSQFHNSAWTRVLLNVLIGVELALLVAVLWYVYIGFLWVAYLYQWLTGIKFLTVSGRMPWFPHLAFWAFIVITFWSVIIRLLKGLWHLVRTPTQNGTPSVSALWYTVPEFYLYALYWYIPFAGRSRICWLGGPGLKLKPMWFADVQLVSAQPVD